MRKKDDTPNSSKKRPTNKGQEKSAAQKKVSVENDISQGPKPLASNRGPISLTEVGDFTRDFARLLQDGTSLVRSLAALEEKQANPEFKRIIGEISQALQKGETLSGTLKQYPNVFSESYINSIRFGEVNGTLDETIFGLAHADDVLPFDEAVKFLGTSRPTLYRLLKQGDLKGLKVGRQWRFNKADLVAYMERQPASLSQVAHSEADAALAYLQEKLGREVTLPADKSSEESKIEALVNAILSIALEAGASDVHFEPKPKGILVRQRWDGVLQEIHTLPNSLVAPIVDRLKMMADMDINEKRVPQDGRIHLKYHEKQLDARVASCPSAFGESITMRLIDSSNLPLTFERLGIAGNNEIILKNWLNTPSGLILITGPTGSGKTTVLYSCIAEIADDTKKTLTIEDPVEFALPHTTQTYVNRKAGLTYATALRAFLRHDPDIIVIGDIANLDTANAALHAAVTGHLVLAAMHTDSAAGAITRLLDLGVEPFMLSASLCGVSTQRLIRRVCPHCREAYQPDAALLDRVREIAGSFELLPPGQNASWMRGRGCAKCRQSGFRGRIGLYELLENKDELGAAIVRRALTHELQEVALKNGFVPLFIAGVRKAAEGVTTLDEVLRITGM